MHHASTLSLAGENRPAASTARAELALAGSQTSSLLESLLAWSMQAVAARAHGLYVRNAHGRLEWHGGIGVLDRATCDALARASWDGEWIPDKLLWQATVLIEGNERRGVLVTHYQHPATTAARELMQDAALRFARRLPGALELERLNDAVTQLAEAERMQYALYRIADLASGERAMDEVFASLHEVIASLMYAENFFIALYDAAQQTLALPYFRDSADPNPPSGEPFPISHWEGSLTLQTLRLGVSLMGPSDQLVREHGLGEVGFGPRSEAWLGVPMLRGTEVIGVLVVQSYDQDRRYGERERALLNFVAQHVVTALDRVRLHSELERRVHQRTEDLKNANIALRRQVKERERAEKLQAALFRIAELGSTSGSLDDFYAALHATIGELIHVRNFYIALVSDEDEGILEFPYSVDERDPERRTRRIGSGVTEYVLRHGRALLATRPMLDDLTAKGEIDLLGARSAVWLGVPLIYDGRTVGVMATQSYDDAHTFGQREQDIMTFVSYHIANALQRKRQAESLREANAALEQRVRERTEALAAINAELRDQIAERERAEGRLRHAALHDALTGLPNRSVLLDRMAHALQRYRRDPRSGFAVLFLDLDRFKVVNDSVGHLIGDELLKAAGERIHAQLPDGALISRLGGDEFAILLEAAQTEAAAQALATRIIQALERPLHVAGRDIYSSASIGITFAQPHYRTAEELLRDADLALYRAKANGRRRFEIFDAALRSRVLDQMELEGDLRRAVARREFEPVYQPIFHLDDGRVAGFEALMRWRHPEHGLLAPPAFLSQAEESGLAEEMDWQVFDIAFAQAEVLLGQGQYLGINVGGRHLRTPRFVETLLHRLDAVGFCPRQLRIEITERVLMDDPVYSRKTIERLRSHGISIALDDFGTGYSSLSYLHQFPLQALKIDRSFVSPLDNDASDNSRAVLRAIHALGTELGLELIAEGIETEEQLRRFTSMGAGSFGQGFLLARPASLNKLLAAGFGR